MHTGSLDDISWTRINFSELIVHYSSTMLSEEIFLNCIGQHLVESCNSVRNTEIDCSVTNLDDESSHNLAVDLVLDLELLACTSKL